MVEILKAKKAELENELAKQVISEADHAEVEEKVYAYRNELLKEKEKGYEIKCNELRSKIAAYDVIISDLESTKSVEVTEVEEDASVVYENKEVTNENKKESFIVLPCDDCE